MYETYYGFTQPPFVLTPDVRFCYQHRSYTRAKAYMEYAVMRGEGFLVVTGRPGMGKTTLIEDLLAELGTQDRLVARVDSTQLDADDLLRLVTYAFGLPALGLDKATLLHSLGDFLRHRPESAGTAILIVDEAQNLSDRSLEELRLITNLQQGPRALIQIFLVGQESLRDVIRQHHLEQLQQRIVAACHLEPLDLVETRAYIRHRLLCAGWLGNPVFQAEALRLIYQASGGVPRLINKVCDRLLLYGSVDELQTLSGDESRVVLDDFRGEFLEAPDGGSVNTGPMDANEAGCPIDDLVWEPSAQSPFRDELADVGEAATRVSATNSNSTESAPGDSHGGDARHQMDQSLATPLPSDDPTKLDSPSGPRGHTAYQGDDSLALGVAREAAPQAGDPTADSSGYWGQFAASGPQREIQSDAFNGKTRNSERHRHHLGFFPYAAAALMVLGAGSLILVLLGGSPGEHAHGVKQLGDSVMDKLKSLTGQPSGDPDPAGPDPGGEPSPPSASSPPLAGTGLTDPIGLGRGAYGGSDVAGSGDRPSETASDALPRSAEPTPKHQEPATLVEETPQAAGHSDTIGLETAESDTARQSRIASAGEASPAPTEVALTRDAIRGLTSDLGSSPENPPVPTPSGSLDHEESTSPPVTAEPVNTDAIAIEEGRADAPGQGEPSLSLESELQNLGLPIRELGDGRLAFDLGEEVSFASDSARLPDEAKRLLDPLAAALLRNPETQITLVGHTDDRGPADYNRRLSLSRARAVAAYLSRQGVPEERLSSQGMGKDAPLPEDDGTPRARQRRVEVIIEPIAR